MVFGSFSTFPGGWVKSKIQLSSVWAELGNIFLLFRSSFWCGDHAEILSAAETEVHLPLNATFYIFGLVRTPYPYTSVEMRNSNMAGAGSAPES